MLLRNNKIASSLSRFLSQLQGNAIGILAAYRPEYSLQENKKRHRELIQDLKNTGYGGVPIKGYYVYKDENAERQVTIEDSVWIPNIDYNDLLSMSKKYEQESFIFGTSGSWALIYTQGEVFDDKINGINIKFTIDKEKALDLEEGGEGYSEWKERPFRLSMREKSKEGN